MDARKKGSQGQDRRINDIDEKEQHHKGNVDQIQCKGNQDGNQTKHFNVG